MKISQIFNLELNQYQLDFIDVDLDTDSKLYIDPYLISLKDDLWSSEVNKTIKNFFNKFINLILNNEYERAIDIYSFAVEPKDLNLKSKL